MLCPTCNNTRPPRDDDDDRKLKKQTIRDDVLSSFAVFFYYYITLCIVGFLLLFFQCLLCAFCGVTIISNHSSIITIMKVRNNDKIHHRHEATGSIDPYC